MKVFISSNSLKHHGLSDHYSGVLYLPQIHECPNKRHHWSVTFFSLIFICAKQKNKFIKVISMHITWNIFYYIFNYFFEYILYAFRKAAQIAKVINVSHTIMQLTKNTCYIKTSTKQCTFSRIVRQKFVLSLCLENSYHNLLYPLFVLLVNIT